MSTRANIIDGKLAESAKYGLVYTCKAGWVDLGHAGPGAAETLWRLIRTETGDKSPDGNWFRVPFQECMGVKKWGFKIIEACAGEDFGVRYGLSTAEKESVALGIFMRVSMQFETMQGTFPYSLKTADSSFSVEDLVSNLISFYRAVRPATDYVSRCEPVDKAAAEQVWDKWGAVGSHKNRQLRAMLFPCPKCANSPTGGMLDAPLPQHLCTIQSEPIGKLYKRWPDIISPRVSAPLAPIPSHAQKRVTVQAGDWLSKIAQREYNDMFLWPIIYDANVQVIGNNPNHIIPGQVLIIPDIKQHSPAHLEAARGRGRKWR